MTKFRMFLVSTLIGMSVSVYALDRKKISIITLSLYRLQQGRSPFMRGSVHWPVKETERVSLQEEERRKKEKAEKIRKEQDKTRKEEEKRILQEAVRKEKEDAKLMDL